jgi:hypothetical protein
VAVGQCPDHLHGAVDGQPRDWVALDGWYVLHGDGFAPAHAPAFAFEDEGIAVYRGVPPRAQQGTEVTAAYGPSPASSPWAPTGRVFIRFAEGTRAETRRASIESAGYAIEQVPGFAPQAAWVRALSGSVRDGLSGLVRLLALPGVQAVEPQLLGERSLRG